MASIFEQLESHTYTPNKCFLCGCQLTNENKTGEHVVPRWLQHEFNLWNQRLTLLNGSFIPYRLLTIPCCFECNNLHLNPIENRVLEAYRGGFETFTKLDQETLFFWLGKIYFGLMYRQLFLNADQQNPSLGTITSPAYLDQFFTHLLFLQGTRGKLTFRNYFPASIYCFKTQKPIEVEHQWDLIDSHNKLFIAIRMGEIGIISLLQDCGATMQLSSDLDLHRQIELHPWQFRELAVKILYKGILINRVPKFINAEHGGLVESNMLSLQGFSDRPIYDEWDSDVYSDILAQVLGVPTNVVQPVRGQSYTWLLDDNGEPRFIDVNS